MFVKICGITNREDAEAAIEAGAQALGFIFHGSSPRSVTADSISSWIGLIPSRIWKVGVFVDESRETVEEISKDLDLDIAQLHGTELPRNYPRGIRVWKAMRISEALAPGEAGRAEALLLDGPGGGKSFDWSLASNVSGKFILAGGLTPENVREAIDKTNPWGVDTASGVESAPGRKDHARMKQFIVAALGKAALGS
jgi:phosphoribosylanthranilate isomerase